jgi:hypothetical protein
VETGRIGVGGGKVEYREHLAIMGGGPVDRHRL